MSDYTPQAELVFELDVTCDPPVPLGEKDGARMLMIPITGGRISGARLNGEVLPGGADWAVIRPDRAEVDARYAIRAEDGTVIQVFNAGTVQFGAGGSRPDVALTRPHFIAPEGPHGWLNHGVFVGTLIANPADMGVVRIGIYRMI